MRIIYSCGNFQSASERVLRIKDALSLKHTVKIAAYTKSSANVSNIDWTLDAICNLYTVPARKELFELLGIEHLPTMDVKLIENILEDVDNFAPDIIICDGDNIFAFIAKALNIRLWYCSPLYLSYLISDIRYHKTIFSLKDKLKLYPKADKILIYSPFGDIVGCPELNYGCEWIRPYHYTACDDLKLLNVAGIFNERKDISKILKCVNFDNDLHFSIEELQQSISNCKCFLTSAETEMISDALYNNVKEFVCCPNIMEPECVLNTSVIKMLGIGDDHGQIEYMDKYAISILENLIKKQPKNIEFKKEKNKFLHEKIEEELCII